MPTIPLFNPDALADAWHQVRAPGGYECWRFEADDASQDRQVIVEFWHGDAFDSRYVDHFNRYVRRPTNTDPPQPQQSICVRVIVIHAGKIEAKSEQSYSVDQFSSQTDRVDVRIGPNQFAHAEGAWMLSIQTEIALRLTLRPRILQPARVLDDGRHNWLLPAPLCEVSGELRLDRPIAFSGRGCHDHLFGDRPLVSSRLRTLRGRVMTDDKCVIFCFSQDPSEALLIEAMAHNSVRLPCKSFEVDWNRLTATVPDVLRLHPPVMLEKTSTIARQMHEAELHGKPVHVISEVI